MAVHLDASSSARPLHRYLADTYQTIYDGTAEARIVRQTQELKVQWANILHDIKTVASPQKMVPRLAWGAGMAAALAIGSKDSLASFLFMGAVAFDANAGNQKSGGGSSLTWSHTCSGSDRIITTGAVHGLGGADGITSSTYAGASQTLKDSQDNTEAGASNEGSIELWYKAGPASGANDVVLNMSIADTLIGMSVSFTGSDGTLGTSVKATGTDTAPTVTASGAAADMFVDVLGHEDHNVSRTAGTNQTGRESRSVANQWAGAMSTAPGAATEAMDWTLGATDQWTIIAVAVKEGTQASFPGIMLGCNF